MFKGFSLPSLNLRKKTSELEPLMVISQDKSNVAMAFGLTWKTVVSEATRKKSKRSAQQEGATHFLSRDQQLCYGRVLPGDLRPGEQLYAASRVVASKLTNGICCLAITEDMFWLTVFRNGISTRIDTIYRSGSDAKDACREIYEDLQSEGMSITVYGNVDLEFCQIEKLSLQDIFNLIDDREIRLVEFPKSEGVPKSVIVLGCVVVISFVAFKSFDEYQSFKRRQRLALADELNQVNHVQVWEAAINKWASETVNPMGRMSTGLKEVRASLGAAPVEWRGWLLKGANCIAVQSGTAAPGKDQIKRNWICSANYERGGSASALSRDLAESTPANWSLEYGGINKVMAKWVVTEDSQSIDFKSLPKVDFHKIQSMSTLQKFRPALAEDVVLSFGTVAIPVPRDEKGQEIPLPAGTPTFFTSNISIKGPLRTIDSIVESDVVADWSEIKIFGVDPYPSSQLEVGPNTSYVNAELNGRIYAKK